MTEKGMRSQIAQRLDAMDRRLGRAFAKRTVGERDCFVRSDGVLFVLDALVPFGALVVEYAQNDSEAKLNRFEDGDLFYLEDMDEDTMFEAMLAEIRS